MLVLEPWLAFEFYRSFLKWYCDWYEPKYLEIGCASGELCASLHTKSSTGVDIESYTDWATYRGRYPDKVRYFQGTSDEFFAGLNRVAKSTTYDLIFIDGDHDRDQLARDVANSLEHLADGGLIAMHDTYPPTREHTHEKWSGTAYQVAIGLRQRQDLEVYTFPVTFGLTLVGKVGTEFPWVY